MYMKVNSGENHIHTLRLGLFCFIKGQRPLNHTEALSAILEPSFSSVFVQHLAQRNPGCV